MHPKARVFPVVERIRAEIDFCFSAFYGDLRKDRQICDLVFNRWYRDGFRGPGELSVYIDMLAAQLETPTQRSIFISLANDAITVRKRIEKPRSRSIFYRYRYTIIFNLLLFGGLAVGLASGLITLD